MRGRPLVFDQEQIRTHDFLEGFRDTMKSEGDLAQFLFGALDTILSGFSAAPKTVPNMKIDLQAGMILQWGPVDTNPYGTEPAVSDYMYHLGFYPAQELTLSKGMLSAGQSQWALIRGRFSHVDEIRDGDPDGGVHPFYNSADPRTPLQGPTNAGEILPSVRKGICEISITYGTPAPSGTEVPPAVGGEYVPLYLINLTFGSTPIGNGDIQVAPAGIPGYPRAPFWKGVRNQHHRGADYGEAPPIDLSIEVAGQLGLPHLPATNTTGLLVVARSGNGDPNGAVAGNKNDVYLQEDADTYWVCKSTGIVSGVGQAVWIQNNPNLAVEVTTFPYTVTKSIGSYFCALSTADGIFNLPSGKPARFRVRRTDDTDKKLIVTVSGTTRIKTPSGLSTTFNVLANQSFDFEYLPSADIYYIL